MEINSKITKTDRVLHFFFNFNIVMLGNETVNTLFSYLIFVTYNVNFTKVMCISMPHQLNIVVMSLFVCLFFHEISFSSIL